MVVSCWAKPTLYNLTNELIWPEVINRARSHPEEVTWRDDNGGTALHHSCRSHYSVEVVREMLNSSRSAASIQDKSGKTPLHIACWSGSSEVIRLLLNANREVASIPDNRGRTPLHHACSSVSLPCAYTIETLIKADPLVSLVTDDAGQTPLSLLCERHESRLLTAMAFLEQEDSNDRAEQIYGKILRPFWDQLRALLSANTDHSFTHNWRLVHVVTTIPDCPRILFDLALKLHPEQVKEKVFGSLPLHYAADCPTFNIDGAHCDGYYVCTLLTLFPRASQIPDAVGRLPLHLAIQSGKTYDAVLRKLFDAFPDAIAARDGKHYLLPFMLAAMPSDARSRRTRRPTQQVDSVLELLRLDPSGIKLISQ